MRLPRPAFFSIPTLPTPCLLQLSGQWFSFSRGQKRESDLYFNGKGWSCVGYRGFMALGGNYSGGKCFICSDCSFHRRDVLSETGVGKTIWEIGKDVSLKEHFPCLQLLNLKWITQFITCIKAIQLEPFTCCINLLCGIQQRMVQKALDWGPQ